jgi:hypothetical protein
MTKYSEAKDTHFASRVTKDDGLCDLYDTLTIDVIYLVFEAFDERPPRPG